MKLISIETKISEILRNEKKKEICNQVSGDLFSNPALAAAETLSLRRVANLLGENGETTMEGIIGRANAMLAALPYEEEEDRSKLDEVRNAVALSSLLTEEERKENARPRDSIRPGQVWYDTKGERIQAHGAQIYYEDGVYYWIGENKDYTRKKGSIWTWGVKVYSSRDLCNWTDLGFLVEPCLTDQNSILFPTRRLDRPHVLYNDKTKKYVLWLKYCDESHFAVLTADRLLGPYTIVCPLLRPFGTMSGDFDLAKDPETGDAYLYWEVNHTSVWGAKLNDAYTDTSDSYAVIYDHLEAPFAREGIAHVLHDGKHYLFSSGMTGYVPNPSQVAVSDDWLEGYAVQGDPNIGDTSCASFNSQFSCIFRVQGTDEYVSVSDRWVPEFVMDRNKYDIIVRSILCRKDRNIRVSEEEKTMFAAMPMMGTADTSVADYVWLPLVFNGDKAEIRWADEWKPSL